MKQNVKKVWGLLFPPKCFGDEFDVAKCINKRIKEGKVDCLVHSECITESIRREVVKTIERSRHSVKRSGR